MVNIQRPRLKSEVVEFYAEIDGRAYRVITRRGCCWARRPIGAGGVGGPNRRSKNDGPDGPE
jgi:hypothetical protein